MLTDIDSYHSRGFSPADLRALLIAACLQRHRGPFTLIGWRPPTTKKGKVDERTVVAKAVSRDEVEELARMALTDPRDTLTSVHVWSDREEQFVTAIKA